MAIVVMEWKGGMAKVQAVVVRMTVVQVGKVLMADASEKGTGGIGSKGIASGSG